jgi:hypothetical protein
MSGEIEASMPRFLNEVGARLLRIRDDRKALSFSLRAVCNFFKANEACVAILPPGEKQAEILFEIPRGAAWNADLLADFLQRRKPKIPANTLLVPLTRRRRTWAVLAVRRRQSAFHKDAVAGLSRIARTISESIERRDWERIVEVRSRIDRKVMEQLRPKDLFYQILHGLRSLTYYDHSSALLIADETESHLELVAEQIAWFKGKSRQIGLKISLNDEHWKLMRSGIVFGFDREGVHWRDWANQNANALARLLDYNAAGAGDERVNELRDGALNSEKYRS